MARVRLNETADLPEDRRWLFERMEQRGGVLNIFRALSHSPEALRRFMKLGSYFLDEGKLEPKLRELAILRVGYVCRARYEFAQHVAFARRAGLSDAQIRGVAEPSAALFDARELAVLAYAGEMTDTARVSDATYAAVAQSFTAEEIVELTLVAGYYNMVSRALNALLVDIDAPAARDLAAIDLPL
ncbi:MAG TPA: carboxymuconolactone decarboxylase family protein [Dehalococcoidia bacterium]|nr:carboxymuconolactone decarboxylase family protein [Dehalococcoidia bacterium]